MFAVIAMAATVSGVAILHRTWRQRSARTAFIVAGWGLLLAALAIWTMVAGAEYGAVLGLTLPGLAALATIASHADVGPGREGIERRVAHHGIGAISIDRLGYHHLVFVLTVPFAGIASLCVASAIALALPWQPANQWALAIFILPLVWSGAALWLTFDRYMPRAAGAIAAVGMIAAASLYLGVL